MRGRGPRSVFRFCSVSGGFEDGGTARALLMRKFDVALIK